MNATARNASPFTSFVEEHYPALKAHFSAQGSRLPRYIERDFDEYVKCGRLEHEFLQVPYERRYAEHLVAFSCKRRSFCASCGARRIAERAALLVDEVFPEQPMSQNGGGICGVEVAVSCLTIVGRQKK